MFFILSKTLGFFAVPSNLLMAVGLVGLALLLTRFRRLASWLIVSSPDQVLNTEWNDGTCKEITANSEKTFDPRHTFLALQIANPSNSKSVER